MKRNRPNVSKDLPAKIKQFRESKGWSQGQLANETGIHIKQISKYERGISFPTVDVLIKLVQAFGIALDDLVFDDRHATLDEITNPDLLKRFEEIGKLDKKSQEALITIMDALIAQHKIKKAAKDP
ncbi:MAG: helix-turn-helix domain-containing protein [Proteobacteria bacterium]|nr:helix-turn-helix domain-containing protein [Pseudomonadota bacterium]